MCGGFSCSRNGLIALNVCYILVGLLLITVAGYGKWAAIVNQIEIIGGIIACGVFLLLISIVGLLGAVKHHQVCLFFYMVILFLLFFIQFAIACACLALSDDQKQKIISSGWSKVDDNLKTQCQNGLDCCGLKPGDGNDLKSHPPCLKLACCTGSQAPCCTGKNSTATGACPCDSCLKKGEKTVNTTLNSAGGLGLFFSFTEIIGVCLAIRYRNQKDPRANPSAFL